jgi:hypothetical protein
MKIGNEEQKEKLKLLFSMRREIENSIIDGKVRGLCGTRAYKRGGYKLEEYGIKKPFLSFAGDPWWPWTRKGMKKRLRAVNDAIERLLINNEEKDNNSL